jgi:hypothetical protein
MPIRQEQRRSYKKNETSCMTENKKNRSESPVQTAAEISRDNFCVILNIKGYSNVVGWSVKEDRNHVVLRH